MTPADRRRQGWWSTWPRWSAHETCSTATAACASTLAPSPDEEAEQFPQLRAHIPAEKLVTMGAKVEAAKKLAPTRPHPHAPHSELFHKTVGPGVGMIDRLRDKLTGRNTD